MLPKSLSELYDREKHYGLTSFHELSGAEFHQDVLSEPERTRYSASFEMLQIQPPEHRQRPSVGTPEERQASAEFMYPHYNNNNALMEDRDYDYGNHLGSSRVSAARRNALQKIDDGMDGEENSPYVSLRMQRMEGMRGMMQDDNVVAEVPARFRQGTAGVVDVDIALDPRLEPGMVFVYTGQHHD